MVRKGRELEDLGRVGFQAEGRKQGAHQRDRDRSAAAEAVLGATGALEGALDRKREGRDVQALVPQVGEDHVDGGGREGHSGDGPRVRHPAIVLDPDGNVREAEGLGAEGIDGRRAHPHGDAGVHGDDDGGLAGREDGVLSGEHQLSGGGGDDGFRDQSR
ncbi:hypothetical protein D3C87_1543820 [compost metagenome]